jgi:flavin reductase (DIM6/NTAB) family NADH-FMN oxidoreductase RutF
MHIDPKTLNRRDMHEMLMAMIMPRPIAWVSTVNENGVFNLAPFSQFTSVSLRPPIVCLAIGWNRDGRKKDTLENIEVSKDFVINVVDESLAQAMNQTSAEYPAGADEFREVGLTAVKSDIVKAPILGESPLSMECKVTQIMQFGQRPDGGYLVLGEVVRFHVRDELYINGEIDVSRLKHVGRLGEQLYCRIGDAFRMERPFIL